MIAKIKLKFVNLKSFDWKLWISLAALALVPAIYQVIRTYFLSTNVSSTGIDIVGQMEWFDLIDETIKAFLIVPLYSILNKLLVKDKNNLGTHIFKMGLVVFILYFIFSICVLVYGFNLISFMNPETNDISAMKTYLQLETIAFMIGIIPSFINVVFVTLDKSKNIYIFLGLQVILGIISDFLLIPVLGVNGIAISNMITNSVLAVSGILVLYFEGYLKASLFKKEDKQLSLDWLKAGLFSGTQQLIDNIVYALMIARMVNMVSEQGNYWVANNFIWGWLLIPVTALGEVIKSDCKKDYSNLMQSNYYLISMFIFIVWSLSIPLWIPFFKGLEKLENYEEIFLITIKLVPFYIAYTLCVIPDSIFIGIGKTYFNAINSLLVNFLYYGLWYIFYVSGLIDFSIDIIIMMFGFGMIFHELISIIEERLFLNHQMKKEANNY